MLTCITPTGGRPEALALCDQYMQAQTNQDFKWVVLDDCDPQSPVPERADEIIRPSWRWDGSEHTLSRSLDALLDETSGAVLIIEDDDLYLPGYVELMAERLKKHDLVGLRDSVYYNVVNRTWKRMVGKSERASLCATGVKGSAKRRLEWIVAKRRWPIDITLWAMERGHTVESDLMVGIKGLPGRSGIGLGHKMEATPDPDGSKLKELAGEFASCYDRFYEVHSGHDRA